MNDVEEYVRLRDEAVLNCDIDKLTILQKKYNPHVYKGWVESNEIVKLATLHKMACAITTMPEWRKDEARKWLQKFGMSEKIY